MAENKSLKSISLKNGLILGVISLLLGIFFMWITKSVDSFITFYVLMILVSFVIPVVLYCIFSVRMRRANGGYWNFKEALQSIFIMLAVTVLVSNLGTVAFNAAVPSLQEEMLDNSLNLTIESMESFGAGDEAVDEAVAKIEMQRDSIGDISFGQVFRGLFISFLLYFVLALILAAIFKKEKPVFEPINRAIDDTIPPAQDPQ